MAQLLFDILGPKWDLWQVPSDEPGVWPQSLLWCLVDVVWMVAHSRGQGQEWQAPLPQDCEGLEAQVRVLQGPGQSIFLGVRKKTSGCPGRQLGTETECPASLGGTGTRGVAATWY